MVDDICDGFTTFFNPPSPLYCAISFLAETLMDYAQIPMRTIGPVKFIGPFLQDELHVPLATFETTVWPSTNRGAKATRLAGGITCTLLSDQMTRAIAVSAPSAQQAHAISQALSARTDDIKALIAQTSRFATLHSITPHQVGNLLYVRLSVQPGDASGHNMATKAGDALMTWLLQEYPELSYVSTSGNVCTDKKVSAVNAIAGRGKSVVAEVLLPKAVCEQVLKTTPEALAALHVNKNLIGSIQAGSLLSANAHFANLLLATYLATGQDAANIVEGSQGMTHVSVQGKDCLFSVTLPNIIVGTVGHGKHHGFVKDNLQQLGCLAERPAGENAQRLAGIIAGTVLCGELSLLAALTNHGELIRSHIVFERGGQA